MHRTARSTLVAHLTALLLALAISHAAHAQVPSAPSDLSARILPSVVTLRIQNKDGRATTANAFLAVKDGVLVTALHVVANATKIVAAFPNGEEFDCPGAIDKDDKRNVALIRIKSFGRPLLAIDPAGLNAGDKLSAAIVRDGAFGMIDVTIKEVRVEGGVKLYVLAGDIPIGNNGSPLVNARGDVVGVHVTATQDGQNVFLALPSAYILALEPSLPVQPWNPPADAAGPGAQPASKPGDAVDAAVASALVKFHDHLLSALSITSMINSITRYSTFDNKILFGLQSQVDTTLSQVTWLKTDDPSKLILVQAIAQLLTRVKSALELDARCNTLNNERPISHEQAQEAANRAMAALNGVPDQIAILTPELRKVAAASPAFLQALPVEVRYFLGVSDRPSRLFLGVYVSSQQPCRLLSTDAKGLADKLGLRSGDTIVSAAGKAFHETDDIEGFKLVIEANLGRTIGVTVSRNGKPRVLSVKVPAEMPAAFLRGQRSAIWP